MLLSRQYVATCVKTNGAGQSLQLEPINGFSCRLNGEGGLEIVDRWPDTDNAESLRLAVASKVSLH